MTMLVVPMLHRQRVESREHFDPQMVRLLIHEKPYMISWFQQVEPVVSNALHPQLVRVHDGVPSGPGGRRLVGSGAHLGPRHHGQPAAPL
jgi:hypothetical protein